jgi:hypothetical protein
VIRLIVFDEPSPTKRLEPFELRYASLVNSINTGDPFLVSEKDEGGGERGQVSIKN